AVRHAIAPLCRLANIAYVGVDPRSFEPIFEREDTGESITFDELPTFARNLIAFGALPARALHAAYPARSPQEAEGVVLIDDADLHLEPSIQRELVGALREGLPRVQWVLTSQSHVLALGFQPSETFALRRMPISQKVELYEGELAAIH